MKPIDRAICSLQGLSVGDGLGGFFEFCHGRIPARIANRQPPRGPWHWTDDTQMALAVVSILQKYDRIDQDLLALELGRTYQRARGYGASTRLLLARIRDGGSWRELSSRVFKGTGSFGNGSLARAAPVGAFYAGDLEKAAVAVQRSTEITHSHPEALAGGIAVAVAAGLAWRQRSRPRLRRQDFLAEIVPYIPESQVCQRVSQARDLPTGTSVTDAAHLLGNGSQVSTQDTVPFALWCVGEKIDSYEDAIWLTLNGLGDCDTTCATVGGIVALYTGIEGIPSQWLQAREPISI